MNEIQTNWWQKVWELLFYIFKAREYDKHPCFKQQKVANFVTYKYINKDSFTYKILAKLSPAQRYEVCYTENLSGEMVYPPINSKGHGRFRNWRKWGTTKVHAYDVFISNSWKVLIFCFLR